jgi:hypothetical protein
MPASPLGTFRSAGPRPRTWQSQAPPIDEGARAGGNRIRRRKLFLCRLSDSVSLTTPRCLRRAPHQAGRQRGLLSWARGMLPNLRVIAASLVASIALMTFGFGLFAAFRIANQSSVVFAHPSDVPAPPGFAQSPEEEPAAVPAPRAEAQPAPATSDNAPAAQLTAEQPAPPAEEPAAPPSPEDSGPPATVADTAPPIETPPAQTAPPRVADTTPSAAKPPDEPEMPAAPAANASAPETLPASPLASAATSAPEAFPASPPTSALPAPTAAPAPADVHADDTAKSAMREAPAATTPVALPKPAAPETTASVKHQAGAKKATKPRHAPAAQQSSHKAKTAKAVRKPTVRRIVRRVAPRTQATAQPRLQPAAQPGYSYSNWSTMNGQWGRQPTWQTPAQPKARSTAVAPAKPQ